MKVLNNVRKIFTKFLFIFISIKGYFIQQIIVSLLDFDDLFAAGRFEHGHQHYHG